jgi:hypothetical protein
MRSTSTAPPSGHLEGPHQGWFRPPRSPWHLSGGLCWPALEGLHQSWFRPREAPGTYLAGYLFR